MYNPKDIAQISKLLESPLHWGEAILKDPSTGSPFKANYVERLILGAKEPRVVIRISRRTGKTYSLSVLALWAVIVHKFYDVLVVAPTDNQVGELFETIREFIEATPAIRDAVSSDRKSPHTIEFKNGSKIKGKTTGASSKQEGKGLRGMGGNMIIVDEAAYLAEGDWKAILPIVIGDKYKSADGQIVRTYVASTPSEHHGRYHQFCHDKTGEWRQIHVPITENPDYNDEDLAIRRSLCNDLEWLIEWLAEFPDVGMNAFKNSDIETAMTDYSYMTEPSISKATKRVMGVDWDKYQAGVNIVIVEHTPGFPKYRLIFREEVPRGEYTLSNAVNRIIALNEAYDPDYIYVDRGYAEDSVERLKLYGKSNPSSGLSEKIKPIMFQENVEIRDPIDGKIIKRQFKAVMLNNIFKLFEDGHFEFSKDDRQFEKQLRGYKILESGGHNIRTTRTNEHIIDAVGLACYGLTTHFNNPFKWEPARGSVSLPAPKVVKSPSTVKREREIFRTMGAVFNERRTFASLGRGSLCSSEPSRTKF